MAKYVYVMTGGQREHFSFLPAVPPSQWLEPGDTVTCSEPVDHPHLQLVENKPRARKTPNPPDALKEVQPPDAAQ